MKRVLPAALAIVALGVFGSVAQALTVTLAEVQNGVAVVQGNKAAKRATITWEGSNVATSSNGGAFSFSGVVPTDCVGTLSDGTTILDVPLANCAPPATMALVPRTGQVTSYAAGDDGATQAGIPLPTPRFTDNANGTLTDNLTGLVWLKNANCRQDGGNFPGTNWATALTDVASLNATGTMNGNDCGDTSLGGSHQTDWRLPNVRELSSLFHFGFGGPSLSNAAGTGKWDGTDGFSNFGVAAIDYYVYWSSNRSSAISNAAFVVDFDGGYLIYLCPYGGLCTNALVLPVRGPAN